MFAAMLKEARDLRGLTVAEVAARSGTSRSAITDYEAGRKQPQFDTASRIMASLGEHIVVAPAAPANLVRWRVPGAMLESLTADRTETAREIKRAWSVLPTVLESDTAIERLGFDFAQVKTVAAGITIAGSALPVERLWTLNNEIRATLEAAAAGHPRPLRVVGLYFVEADPELPDGHRELDFVARASECGADPATVRHLASASLAAEGYPYLWVPFRQIEDYEKAVLACRRTGDASRLLSILLESAQFGRDEP